MLSSTRSGTETIASLFEVWRKVRTPGTRVTRVKKERR